MTPAEGRGIQNPKDSGPERYGRDVRGRPCHAHVSGRRRRSGAWATKRCRISRPSVGWLPPIEQVAGPSTGNPESQGWGSCRGAFVYVLASFMLLIVSLVWRQCWLNSRASVLQFLGLWLPPSLQLRISSDSARRSSNSRQYKCDSCAEAHRTNILPRHSPLVAPCAVTAVGVESGTLTGGPLVESEGQRAPVQAWSSSSSGGSAVVSAGRVGDANYYWPRIRGAAIQTSYRQSSFCSHFNACWRDKLLLLVYFGHSGGYGMASHW